MKYNVLLISFIIFVICSNFFEAEAKKLILDCGFDHITLADRTDLNEVVITEKSGVTEIPDYAFLGCSSLKKVTLPSTVKKIGFQAFSECEALEEINLPEGLEDIGSNSFAYCKKLKSIKFPMKLKHIGHNAFSFCGSLTDVMLPDSIEELESYAFSDCINLKEARLPANDKLLGEQIFNCCPNLEVIIELSPTVPEIDCASFLFDPLDEEMLNKCRLYVLSDLIEEYRESPSFGIIRTILPMK